MFFLENNVVSNVSVLIDTNIDNNFQKTMKSKKPLGTILKLAPGCTLRAFMEKAKGTVPLRQAIVFCTKLLKITKSFHACGVIHRDLKPDNIHIDCSQNKSLDEGDITILDFGLAYIERNLVLDDKDLDILPVTNPYETQTGDTIGNQWYRVPQMTKQSTTGLTDMQKNEIVQQRRSPSIDASSICGILFWLLTKTIPGEEYAKKHEPAPHEKILKTEPNIWKDIIQKAIIEEGK